MILKPFAFLALAALALLTGCERPTHDPAALRAIRAEAKTLMETQPADADTSLPESRWPRVIASLEPDMVQVYPWGVEITVTAYFDGGWGYFVPLDDRVPPEPAGRFSKLEPGIYWYHPY